MQRLPTSEEEDERDVFHIDSADSGSFDHADQQHAVEQYHDESDDDDDNDRDSEDSANNGALEMGQVARHQKRRLQSMGIMLGDDFAGDDYSQDSKNSCSKYWYLWLCCGVVLVSLFLVTEGAMQYQKQAALLHASGANGDEYDAAQCQPFNKKALQVLKQRFAHANETATFCQADKLEQCNCKHPFRANKPDNHISQWAEIATMNQAMVEKFTKHIKPDVVMLGDSIVEHWNGMDVGPSNGQWRSNKKAFDKLFSKKNGGKVNGAALGIGGDRIQNLLYRLQNGEAPKTFHPAIWWILIGTNDLQDFCSSDTITVGNFQIVEEIRKFHPGATIVLNSILPRNEEPDDLLSSPTWPIIQEINLKLECYANTARGVEFFNATDVFIAHRKGKTVVNSQFMKDAVHPNGEGSRLWGEAIVDRVVELKVKKKHHKNNNHHHKHN